MIESSCHGVVFSLFLSLFPDSSSVSEKRRPPVVSVVSVQESRRPEVAAAAPERRERPTPAALRRNPSLRNPSLRKELRPALEHALAEKLEDLDLRPVRCREATLIRAPASVYCFGH